MHLHQKIPNGTPVHCLTSKRDGIVQRFDGMYYEVSTEIGRITAHADDLIVKDTDE